MSIQENIANHQAFIFELDNVLYPEKDYLLQVYYLFAQFIEYTEQRDAGEIIEFMRETYDKEGDVAIFFKTATHFNLPEKYKVNFDLLHQNARLPLKLLMFARVLNFIQEIISNGKQVFLLASGHPAMQLNKIRQMEWNGTEKQLKLYFSEEIEQGSVSAALQFIMEQHTLAPQEVMFINNCNTEQKKGFNDMLNCINIDKLLLI